MSTVARAVPPPARRARRPPTGWLAAALLLLLCGVVLHAQAIDPHLMLKLQAVTRNLPPALWSSLSVLGLGLSALILAALVSTTRLLPLAATLWTLAIGGLAVRAVKRWAALPRPAAVLTDGLDVIGQRLMSGSMPSGHAATAGALVVLLAISWAPGRRWWPALIAAGVITASARVAVGAHWPSDVLVGAGLGMASALLALQLALRWPLHRRLAGRRGQIVVGLGQLVAGAAMFTVHTGYPLGWPMQAGLGLASLGGGLWRIHRAVARPAAP